MPIVAEDERILILKLILGPYETNTYALISRKTRDSVVIDAPGDAGKVLEQLKGTNPQYILMTHNHLDHVGALAELKTALGIPIAAHAADADKLPAQADKLLRDGDRMTFGDIQISVLHTPGHTSGSLCFLADRYLISGDTLFPGGPGHTATPAALRQIMDSITTKLLQLPPDTQVYPGHGESTTLKKEKPAIEKFCSRHHDPNLCGDVLWVSS